MARAPPNNSKLTSFEQKDRPNFGQNSSFVNTNNFDGKLVSRAIPVNYENWNQECYRQTAFFKLLFWHECSQKVEKKIIKNTSNFQTHFRLK
jgi:hypothetical protein